MRVQWWWGAVTFVPILIFFFVLVGATGGFQSPADVEGDRAISISKAEQDRAEAERAYGASVWEAGRVYDDEMPTAQRWSQRYYGVPMGGAVTIGLVGIGIACTVLASVIGACQAALQRRGARKDLDRRRAHELEVQREQTRQAELAHATELLRVPLPAPSKPPAEKGTS